MALSPPDLASFRARYPAFASVSDADVTYWLTDSIRYVDESWPIEGDRDPAMMAHAAYEMVLRGTAGVPGGAAASAAAQGLTRWRSGSADLQFSDDAVKQAIAGGYESNIYGQEYLALLQRNKGGPGVTSAGAVPCGGWPYNGYAGLLGFPARLFP